MRIFKLISFCHNMGYEVLPLACSWHRHVHTQSVYFEPRDDYWNDSFVWKQFRCTDMDVRSHFLLSLNICVSQCNLFSSCMVPQKRGSCEGAQRYQDSRAQEPHAGHRADTITKILVFTMRCTATFNFHNFIWFVSWPQSLSLFKLLQGRTSARLDVTRKLISSKPVNSIKDS